MCSLRVSCFSSVLEFSNCFGWETTISSADFVEDAGFSSGSELERDTVAACFESVVVES